MNKLSPTAEKQGRYRQPPWRVFCRCVSPTGDAQEIEHWRGFRASRQPVAIVANGYSETAMCLSPMSPHPLGEETLATSTDSISEFSEPQPEPSATSEALHVRSGDGAATSFLLPPGGA